MKNVLKNIFKAYQHFLFKSIVLKSNKTILLLDVDNTLADTWPSLTINWESETIRVKSLPPINNIIEVLKSSYPTEDYEWIFITSRSYILRRATINWLRNQNLPATDSNVILVQNPTEKIVLIKKYVRKFAIYFDDLSYNHELGEIKFYMEEINQIKKLENVQYFGFDQLNKLINED